MLNNYRLMALMEASKQKSQNEGGDDDLNFEDPMADDGADDSPDTDTNTKENTDSKDTNDSDNKDTEESKDDENKDDQEDESNDNKDDDNPDDDFNMDPDGSDDSEGEDSGENPDGLPDPDDDGTDDTDGAEQNIHTNILELSKLDRQMAKRKIFNDMKDLRSSVVAAKNMIDKNESVIDAAVREYIMGKLDYLYSVITDYLTYKFSFTNYEENMQNHLIFAKELNDLLNFTKTNQNGFVKAPNDKEPTKKGKKSKQMKAEKIDVDKSVEEQEAENEESEDEEIEEAETEEES